MSGVGGNIAVLTDAAAAVAVAAAANLAFTAADVAVAASAAIDTDKFHVNNVC